MTTILLSRLRLTCCHGENASCLKTGYDHVARRCYFPESLLTVFNSFYSSVSLRRPLSGERAGSHKACCSVLSDLITIHYVLASTTHLKLT